MTAALVRAVSALLLISYLTIAVPVSAEPAISIGIEAWSIYGTPPHFVRDSRVPGNGAVSLPARSAPGDEWSSAASLPLPKLTTGERISVIFWARADRPTKVPVSLQAKDTPYANFAHSLVDLTPTWQRVEISGVAPSEFPAGWQVLSVQVGKTSSDVSLGPVLFTSGEPDSAQVDAAFAAYEPRRFLEDVHIASDPGVALAGRLTLPRHHGAGPFPIVLILAGTGPTMRGGYGPLEDWLVDQGIATFDYDKRGVGQSTGTQDELLPALSRDAEAAIRYLRTRADIDPKRIALLGHSEGAIVAPAVAAHDPGLAGIVMLTGPVGDGRAIFMASMAQKLAAGGAPAAGIKQATEAAGRLMEARSRGADTAEIAHLREAVVDGFMACGFTRPQAEGAMVFDSPGVLEMWNSDPARVLASVRVPVLSLFGSDDPWVPTAQSLPAAKAALKNNPDASVIEIGGVDHNLRYPQDEVLQPLFGQAPPEVLMLIGNWLDAHLHPTKGYIGSLK